jgi:hypothetical protein
MQFPLVVGTHCCCRHTSPRIARSYATVNQVVDFISPRPHPAIGNTHVHAAGMMDGMMPKTMTDEADFSSDAGPF